MRERETAYNLWTAEGSVWGRFSDDLMQAVILVKKQKCFPKARSTEQTWDTLTKIHFL